MGKRIVILGSTGSIGRRTLDVVQGLGQDWRVVGLAAGENWQELAKQARKFLPRYVAIANPRYLELLRNALKDLPVEVSAGDNAVRDLSELPEADFVL